MQFKIPTKQLEVLQNIIDVNVKQGGLNVLQSTTNMLETLATGVKEGEDTMLELTDDNLKMIDAFLDGALRAAGLQAINAVVGIVEVFAAGKVEVATDEVAKVVEAELVENPIQ